METLATVMAGAKGRKEGEPWRTQTPDEHIAHAFIHLLKHAQGDTSEPHVKNAFTRLGMAIENGG